MRTVIIRRWQRLIESEVRRALAIGADHFVHLYHPSWGEKDAWSTAMLLGKAIRKVSADLVLCGTFCMDLGRGEVGQYIASQLSFPFIGNVVRLAFTGNDISYIIERSLGKGDLQPRVHLGPGVSPRPRTKRIPFLEGSLPGDERMEWLLFGDSGRKKGAIQEGDPVDLAESLLKLLRDNGLLKTHGVEEQGDE
jgi:hypothetical protein